MSDPNTGLRFKTVERVDDVAEIFHPSVARWFNGFAGNPTNAQAQSWPKIQAGLDTLISAPTGSGKTLAAFLVCIDQLVRLSLSGNLSDKTLVLYVSPLRALSNDIRKNLEAPLQGIAEELADEVLEYKPLRAAVRTGDTSQSERAKMRREAPHILVTTPESLYILVSSESGRNMLSNVRSVIIDEIHALAGSKRGAHLLLSLSRLEAMCEKRPQRIGLSATQKPISRMAEYLSGKQDCEIVDTGHIRERDLQLALPSSPMATIMSNEVWEEVYDMLAAMAREHSTTLVFANNRRLVERATRHLGERLGEEQVAAHHGSLAKEHRLQAEQRLKSGTIRLLVATSSLELGIDIGDVDLVCQLGSPRSIAGFLQRVGRSGHSVGGCPKGRLFPLSLDDLVECSALLHSVEQGELDQIAIPECPLDVLAQQIVAEVASREWSVDELYNVLRAAQPFYELSESDYKALLDMLADGYSSRWGRRGAYLHYDRVNGIVRARRGARLTAITNGGTIPDQFDYDVIMMPSGHRIGTLNEDFAFESLPGDIFQLGNISYRMLKIETGRVLVEDAQGMPPNIPFWFGEAPGRTDELSVAVSQLRESISEQFEQDPEAVPGWLQQNYGLSRSAAEQLAEYLGAAHAALGGLPTQKQLILERFFDETGDMHLVIHAPFGSRMNRALGLSLRKRFCRKFNFELQAAALEDSLVLSLGPTHSFPLDEVMGYLNANTLREVLIQALLDAPMFEVRWRWNATNSLAIKRRMGNQRRLPQLQRSDAEDLIAVVFPDQLACLENIAGARELPDHPLVTQTIKDCLTDVMDVDKLEAVYQQLESDQIKVLCRDLSGPSPLSGAVLTAKPYAFLDDAPAEERRTANVRNDALTREDAAAMASPSEEAVRQVTDSLKPKPRDAEEMHDALVVHGFLLQEEVEQIEDGLGYLEELSKQQRVCQFMMEVPWWVSAERLAEALDLHREVETTPRIQAVDTKEVSEPGLVSLLRSRMESDGLLSVVQLSRQFNVKEDEISQSLLTLQYEGSVLQTHFGQQDRWAHRRVLARIQHASRSQRRKATRTVTASAYMRFLSHWHGLTDPVEGVSGTGSVLAQLEGHPIQAKALEAEVLPARISEYEPHALDHYFLTGEYVWFCQPRRGPDNSHLTTIHRPVVITPRAAFHYWQTTPPEDLTLTSLAETLQQRLSERGALFAMELAEGNGMLDDHLEQGLAELVSSGLINSDGFNGLRYLITTSKQRRKAEQQRRRGAAASSLHSAGRWSLLPGVPEPVSDLDKADYIARVLMRRYGVVFRAVLQHEKNLPSWRHLLYVLRRMEDRGEVSGGRFVDGFSGEQFADPEALPELYRNPRESSDQVQVISAVDPLNLTAVISPGQRIPHRSGNRIAYRGGTPVCALVHGELKILDAKQYNPEMAAVLRVAGRSHQRKSKAKPGAAGNKKMLWY